MKIVLAASPIAGHVNPLLVVARILQNAGHETAMYTGSQFRKKAQAAGTMKKISVESFFQQAKERLHLSPVVEAGMADRVFVTRPIPDAGLAALRAVAEVHVREASMPRAISACVTGPVPGPSSITGPERAGSTCAAMALASGFPDGATAPVFSGLPTQESKKRT